MIEVGPSDLRGYVEPHVRLAVRDGTALSTAALLSQGDMRRLLVDRDVAWAGRRGLLSRTTDELRADLDQALVDREGELYRRQPEFGEHVEDRIDELIVELDRRGVPAW